MKKIVFLLTTLVLVQITGMTAFASNIEEVSEENLKRAISAYKHGVELVRVKAYDSAIEAFNKALIYHPKMTDAYFNIASVYVAQKKYDEAYDVYVKIIALNPYDYDAILQAAKISYNRQNYALAMKYLKYIPDDYPNYSLVQQMYRDAQAQFNQQKNTIERSKISKANENKKILIDKFNSPAGMAVDSQGNMFVASYTDNAIVKVDKDKNKTNFVKDYLLDGPVGLAIDAYDNIYVANFEADNILKITKSGNVSVFMENVSNPYFLYIKDDILYISEQGNDVVITYNLSTTKQ